MLVHPHPAAEPHPGLHLVEHEQRLVFVRDVAQRAQELGAEMVVAALGLDRLDQDGCDVVGALDEGVADQVEGVGFLLLHTLDLGLVGREAELGIRDPRPIEAREVLVLARIGGVGHRQRVARAPVEGLAEVDHLVTLLGAMTLAEVAPHLPVEGRLERVLHPERAARDQEQVWQVAGHRQAA